MRVVKNKRVTESKLVDITCDICGKSCRGSMDMGYEMVSLQGHWGYDSRKDLTSWNCDICEDCADKVQEFIESLGGKIAITNHTGAIISG